MKKTTIEPRSLLVSARFYQALLAVYPSEFRQAYGGPMLRVFRDCGQRALRESGHAGLLSLWARTMLDTVHTALEEHAQRGVEMSRQKFYKLSGWALMLAAFTWALGWVASTRPEYDRFNFFSLPVDQFANALEIPLIVIGILLISLGFIGLLLRYGQEAGSLGQFSLVLGSVCGVISAVGAIGLSLNDSELWWSIFFYSMTAQFLALTLFGIISIRQRVLPRWNILPLLAGIWLPFYVLVSLLIEQTRGGWAPWPDAITLILMLVTMAGLAGLGYLVQSDAQPAGAAEVAA